MVNFAYAVGRIRALEAHLLDENRIIRMVDAKDLQSSYLILRESPAYAEKIDHLEHPFDFETLLRLELEAAAALLKYLAPGNKILSVILKKYDPSLSLPDYLALLRDVAEEHPFPIFKKYAQGFVILNQLKAELLRGEFDPDAVQARYRYTDFHRAVSTGLDNYKRTGSLFALEREIDNHLMRVVQMAKYKVFGIEPLIGFAVAKEIEVKIVRLILTAKRFRITPEEIKERLRLPYV